MLKALHGLAVFALIGCAGLAFAPAIGYIMKKGYYKTGCLSIIVAYILLVLFVGLIAKTGAFEVLR